MFVVRVFGPDGTVAGVGALVGERWIVTCAHVVNAALGLHPLTQERPNDRTAWTWDSASGASLATLVPLADSGNATLLPDGSYKLDGDPGDTL